MTKTNVKTLPTQLSGRLFIILTVTKSWVLKLFALSFMYRGLNHSNKEWYKPRCKPDFFIALENSPVRVREICIKMSLYIHFVPYEYEQYLSSIFNLFSHFTNNLREGNLMQTVVSLKQLIFATTLFDDLPVIKWFVMTTFHGCANMQTILS